MTAFDAAICRGIDGEDDEEGPAADRGDGPVQLKASEVGGAERVRPNDARPCESAIEPA
jgi:hypothetical protein